MIRTPLTQEQLDYFESLGLDVGDLEGPRWVSDPHDIDNDSLRHYSPLTVELWNVSLSKGAKSLLKGDAQRFMVAWPEMSTQFEVIVVPCNNRWDEMRLTGTDGRYVLVSILGFGAYPIRLEGYTHPSYIMQKLNLGLPEACGMSFFLLELSKEFERLKDERFDSEQTS